LVGELTRPKRFGLVNFFFSQNTRPLYCRLSLTFARRPTGAPPKHRPGDKGSEPYLRQNNNATNKRATTGQKVKQAKVLKIKIFYKKNY